MSDDPTQSFREALSAFAFRYHVNHPFDKLLQSGRASKEMLRAWAANRYYYQDTIPRKDAMIIARCPDSAVRGEWCKHVITHDVDNALGEWLLLTRSLGLEDEDVKKGTLLLPATKFACDAYYNFCRDSPWQDGICSSMTHLFAGDIHRMRIANWPQRYPWLPAEAFTYFTNRTQTLPGEIESTLRLLAGYYTESQERMQRAVAVLKFKQDVLWCMMDALWHHFFAVECRIPSSPSPSSSSPPLLPLVRVLGSGAGGGLPQWNRKDALNDAARHGCVPPRSQSSVAVRVKGDEWLLVNCSPDVRYQWNDLLRAHPRATLTDILLTDAQLDHVGGLLSLREADGLRIHATKCVLSTLREDTSFLSILERYTRVECREVEVEGGEEGRLEVGEVRIDLHVVERRRPKYATRDSSVLAVGVEKKVLYSPCVSEGALTDEWADTLRAYETILFDGTFATSEEMPTVSGHAPMESTLAFFDKHSLPTPTFTHLNNSNPASWQEGEGRGAGPILAYDTMEVSASSPPPTEGTTRRRAPTTRRMSR